MGIGRIGRRCAAGILLGAVLGNSSAQDAIRLTEKEAVDRALARREIASWNTGMQDAAESDILQARTLPNPVFGLEREPLTGSIADDRQSTYSLSQRFELGGKRALRIDAAQARLVAARAETDERQRVLVTAVRRHFYEALAHQRSGDALGDWEKRLAELEGIAEKLQKGGEVAGYDRRRVGRERLAAISRAKVAAAGRARAMESLRSLAAVTDSRPLDLVGELLPPSVPPLETYAATLESRPDLRALEARTQAYRLEQRLAERDRIPDVTLSAGLRQVDRGPLSDSGLVVGVSIPLPIFERGEAGSRRAAGQALAAEAERGIALSKAQGDVRGLWTQAAQLRGAGEEFRREAVAASARLAEIARAAYRGGELGVLELLDAQRSLLDAQIQALEIELAARMAMLELESAATGGNR